MFIARHTYNKVFYCLMLSLFLLVPLAGAGAEPANEQASRQSASQDLQDKLLNPMDEPRNYVSQQIVSFAREIDSFFGTDREFQEANKSVVQLNLVRTVGQLGDYNTVFSGRAKVDLPSTQKRLHLVVESDPDKNVGRTDAQTQQEVGTLSGATTVSSYAAALRYEVSQLATDSHFSADAGMQFQGFLPNPFARTRISFSVPLGEWRLKPAELVFWFRTIGAGETTQVDLERVVSDPLLFRATTIAAWLDRQQNFDLSQSLSLYQTINERNAMLYQASIVGISNPSLQVTDKVLLLQYRHRLHRKWMFFELSPQLHYPGSRGYHPATLLYMNLQVNFDETR